MLTQAREASPELGAHHILADLKRTLLHEHLLATNGVTPVP